MNDNVEEMSLDELIEKEGTEVTEKYWKDNPNIPKFAYNDNTPIPGQETEIVTDIDSINENTALESLVIKSAMAKAYKEKEDRESAAEKARIRKQVIDQLVYNDGEAFYTKYHHMMDGKTKRRIRRIHEKNYDAGKYNYLLTTNNLNEP